MKKLFVRIGLALGVALAGIYIQSAIVFSASGVNRFLDELEELLPAVHVAQSLRGRVVEVLADQRDVEVLHFPEERRETAVQ